MQQIFTLGFWVAFTRGKYIPGVKVAIVGAGAAGSMAAIFAASGGAETTLLERTADGGRKILISGGGRCNILPARLDETRFITDSSPHTLRNIVRSWPLREQVEFFERELSLPLVEEAESAKLFPASNRARDVRDGLLALATRHGARLMMNATVTDIRREDSRWCVEMDNAAPLIADAVIIATGGLSVSNTGSDGRGLSILRRLGHVVRPTYAALTPIRAEHSPFGHLAGVSLRVTITATSEEREATATGGFLFTHQGYSGPSVLDVSHVIVRAADAKQPATLRVRWSDTDWDGVLSSGGAKAVLTVLREHLPERLAEALLILGGVDGSRPLAQLKRDERRAMVEQLERCELPWTGHEGYRKAEVTGGGVDLAEIDPRTMESRRHPGLYICGEALDAFGTIGGYNFLWAWATGRAAGRGAASG